MGLLSGLLGGSSKSASKTQTTQIDRRVAADASATVIQSDAAENINVETSDPFIVNRALVTTQNTATSALAQQRRATESAITQQRRVTESAIRNFADLGENAIGNVVRATDNALELASEALDFGTASFSAIGALALGAQDVSGELLDKSSTLIADRNETDADRVKDIALAAVLIGGLAFIAVKGFE